MMVKFESPTISFYREITPRIVGLCLVIPTTGDWPLNRFYKTVNDLISAGF